MSGFWKYYHSTLQIPAQHNLSSSFIVFFSDGSQYIIFKQTASAFTERCPCLNLHIIFFHPLHSFCLLIQRMCFHLIDHRDNTGKICNVHKSVRIKVGNTNCTDYAFGIQVFQCTVCTIIIGKRLVQQH